MVSAAEVAARVADRHWHRYRAGQGAKGPRWYAWAWARIDDKTTDGCRRLLIRRNLTTGEPASYHFTGWGRCSGARQCSPRPTG